jgi:HEAT repeat protein
VFRRAALVLVCSMACASLVGFDWVGRRGRLARELESPDPLARSAAVRELAAHPATEVEPWVLAALEDDDEDVRADAAWTAGRLRLAAAAPTLLGWLASEDDDVRATAARALGAIDDDAITDALVRALGDARASVRMAAIDGLRARPSDDSGSRAAALIGALADSDAGVREAAASALALAAHDGSALFALSSAAGDDAPEVRSAVACSLGALGDTRAGGALRRLLGDPIAAVRSAAALAVGRLRYDGATPELASLTLALASADEREVATAAIAALGQVPGSDAFGALAAAGQRAGSGALASTARASLEERMRWNEAACRAEIVAALEVGEPSQVQWITAMLASGLVRGLEDASPPLIELMGAGRVPEEQALGALGFAGGDAALRTLLVSLEDAQRAGLSMDAPLDGLTAYFEIEGADGRATDPLMSLLERTTESTDRERVLTLLGATRSARSAPLLIRELAVTSDPTIARALLAAIAMVPTGALTGDDARGLESSLRSRHPAVRLAAADAIAAHGDGDTLRRLLDALAHEVGLDRIACMRTLAVLARRLGPDDASGAAIATALARRISSEDAGLADAAIDALARWGAPPALDALLALRSEDVGETRMARIVAALGRFEAERARDTLREILRGEPTREVLRTALLAIGEHGDLSDAIELLGRWNALTWPTTASASFALARMARRGVLDATLAERLCALGEQHDPVVRANVAVAMASLGERCAQLDPAAWMERPHAPIVRSAAARWATATGDVAATRRCLDRLPPPSVGRACADPTLAPLTDTVELRAVAFDGRALPDTEVALILADGSVALLRTDANANVFLARAPLGDATLEAPQNLPLEP